jgi:hypothetical protein
VAEWRIVLVSNTNTAGPETHCCETTHATSTFTPRANNSQSHLYPTYLLWKSGLLLFVMVSVRPISSHLRINSTPI